MEVSEEKAETKKAAKFLKFKAKCDNFTNDVLYHKGDTVEGIDLKDNPNFEKVTD